MSIKFHLTLRKFLQFLFNVSLWFLHSVLRRRFTQKNKFFPQVGKIKNPQIIRLFYIISKITICHTFLKCIISQFKKNVSTASFHTVYYIIIFAIHSNCHN